MNKFMTGQEQLVQAGKPKGKNFNQLSHVSEHVKTKKKVSKAIQGLHILSISYLKEYSQVSTGFCILR